MFKIVFTFFLFSPLIVMSQFDHQPVFSDLSGDELLSALQDNYTFNNGQSYKEARILMYTEIDLVDDSLECVYTGHKKFVDINSSDPIGDLYNNGVGNSFNAEHTYPQSKGSGQSPAKTDLHHLFPTRSVVNSARGSDAFNDIDDQATIAWYYLDQKQDDIPSNNKDAFSEDGSFNFEPREEHKGDVARAIFYFYSIYRTQAQNADQDFFESQKETLCEWHYLDPVDQKEWERTFKIAAHQNDIPNPFVLDCSLSARLYCQSDINCGLVKTVDTPDRKNKSDLVLFPNPSDGSWIMDFDLIENSSIVIGVYNFEGKIVNYDKISLSQGSIKVPFKHKLENGNYIVKVIVNNSIENSEFKEKIVVIK